MHYFLRVNIVQRDADHCENSKDILFWQKLSFVLIGFDNFGKTLAALFHYNAWKVIFVFDNINDIYNHWVFECS